MLLRAIPHRLVPQAGQDALEILFRALAFFRRPSGILLTRTNVREQLIDQSAEGKVGATILAAVIYFWHFMRFRLATACAPASE